MKFAIISLLALSTCFSLAGPANAERSSHTLSGEWQFRREDDGSGWKTVTIPSSFEEHEGTDFDGVGTYKKQLEPITLPVGMRAIIHFQAVATLAEVTFDGQLVGKHLGGWTPFRIDVTELVRKAKQGANHELVVRVDEKVGHNSQGFLPVFAPHFGGIWQDVQLLIVPDCWIDDLSLQAIGNTETGKLQVSVPLLGTLPKAPLQVEVRYRLRGQQEWSLPTTAEVSQESLAQMASRQRPIRDGVIAVAELNIPVLQWKPWSPADPNLYELEIRLNSPDDLVLDLVSERGAFRSLRAEGDKILLNGKPLVVRGLLNWGYAPPRVAPSIDEKHYRAELELARERGFNLMKFCLWVPPKRYLELADELGMLTWMEYPTWHSKWTPDQLPTLEREFTEFFCYDRNHPSVTLRSLTCETGPSADLDVIRTLYDRCHAMIPGSLVEDDSSWISWNRVHDFYDDHPYGNNHTWVATLERLENYIAERTEKPLVLGEAIAADTWIRRTELLQQVGDGRPFWLPRFMDGNQEWEDRMRAIAGPGGLQEMVSESKQYALLMRKYQIETYRREVPFGGYVVSVIRDIPLCSMGLVDFLGRPKWSAADWAWHQDTMLLLKTPDDRRSFLGGTPLTAQLAITHFADHEIEDACLKVQLRDETAGLAKPVAKKTVSVASAGLHEVEPLAIQLPVVTQPTRVVLEATLTSGDRSWKNVWPLWIIPRHEPQKSRVRLHASCSDEIRELFAESATPTADSFGNIIVTGKLDESLIDFVTDGGRLLVFPNGTTGSFPLEDQWFLRGAPFIADHSLLQQVPRKMLLELQHFDLAGQVIPDIKYAEHVDPIVMLWNNHDLDYVKTQGLLFETKLGKGRMLVSAFAHGSPTNAAGNWLVHTLVDHLKSSPLPRHGLDPKTVEFMKAKLNEQRIELVSRQWDFKPDPDNNGLQQKWHLPETKTDESWKPIRIGSAWEGQDYPTLDGWAWYRIKIQLPDDWKGQQSYVSFEGVDDYYELYVNGHKAGSGGDIETRTTAFEDRTSHNITRLVQPGAQLTIAIRVYDWYGAGGVFLPVTISTVPIDSGVEMLK